jgi:hypothetical protein
MPNSLFRAALAASLFVPVAACEPDPITDIPEQRPDTSRDARQTGALVTATDTTPDISVLRTPTGSAIRFIEVRHDDRAGVLLVEEGEAGSLVMDRLIEAAGGHVGASDLYASLVRPDLYDPAVAARLRKLTGTAAADRPSGWARDLVAGATATALASSAEVACNDANFRESIPGGFRSNVFRRLDTGPAYHPTLWTAYDWSGVTHYWYQASANDTPRWRGKVCGRAGFHPDVRYFNGWRPSIPYAKFVYRSGQSWAQAGGTYAFGSGLRVVAWIYDGDLGPIDWKLQIFDAYIHDEFDVMMSWS